MKIEKRTEPLRIVRSNQKVPGVLFGKTIIPVSIQVDEKDLHECVKTYGYTNTFKVKLGKETHLVYIKEIQYDVLNHQRFLNVKLLKVSAGDTIKTSVPIHIVGREAIERPGVIIQEVADSIDVEYPAEKGIGHIEVDLSGKQVGDNIHVKDLTLPDYLTLHDDPNKILVSISEMTYAEEEPEEVEEDIAPDESAEEEEKKK